ncbi:MAG: phosphotransferase [Cyanobacteria bacterium J06559_3]
MRLEPTCQGGSNKTYFIHTLTDTFVLKIYAATAEISQIEYEHRLLAFLQEQSPSFSLPTPIPTSNGETLVHLETESRSLRASLLPRLSGKPANRHHLKQVYSIGCALAELHAALAEFDPDGKLARLPYWGNLSEIHPAINNPLEIARILDLGRSEQTALNQILTEVLAEAAYLYTNLPVQTIHADYITPNILVDDDQVVSILDFEYATRDLRLLDYLSSLDELASFPWKERQFESIIRAFSTGYRERNALSLSEQEAITTVWRLQRASSLVYWTGWVLEGKVDRLKVADAAIETVRFETWLQQNRGKLLASLIAS